MKSFSLQTAASKKYLVNNEATTSHPIALLENTAYYHKAHFTVYLNRSRFKKSFWKFKNQSFKNVALAQSVNNICRS